MFTEDRMSDANREQVTAFITGIWNNMVKAVSESRKISADSLNAYADRVVMFEGAEAVKKAKLVDGLLYHDEVKAEVKANCLAKPKLSTLYMPAACRRKKLQAV
jgi:protease-4